MKAKILIRAVDNPNRGDKPLAYHKGHVVSTVFMDALPSQKETLPNFVWVRRTTGSVESAKEFFGDARWKVPRHFVDTIVNLGGEVESSFSRFKDMVRKVQ